MTYAWDCPIDGGGRGHAVAFDPNNPGHASLCGDVWGIHRTDNEGAKWYGVMSGCKLKNTGNTSGDIYGRGTVFSKMRHGRAYFGCGTLTGGISGWFGHVDPGMIGPVKDSSTTYGFGTTFATSPASISPRPAGRLIDVDYDSIHGVEYIYIAPPVGVTRVTDDGSGTLQFTQLGLSFAFAGAYKFVCCNNDASVYVGEWGNRQASISGNVYWLLTPRGTTLAQAQSGAPPFVNDMKLIGGTLYAVANNGWFGTVNGNVWTQVASSFFSGCDLSSVCGVGNVLYVSTSSHPAGSNKWWAKSVDGGANWTWLTNVVYTVQGTTRHWWLNPAGDGQNKGPNDTFATIHMDCDPSDPNVWIAAGFRGAWSSTDGGATIQPSMNQLSGSECAHVRVDGPGQITTDDVDWHGIQTTNHYDTYTALGADPTGFVGSGVGAKTFFGSNYTMQTTTPPADITKDGVSIADDTFRSHCIAPADYQVDADGFIYVALYGGGILRGDPQPIEVNIITPSNGAALQQSSITVEAVDLSGLPVDHATVQVNNSTPLSMTFDNVSQHWQRLVSLPNGSVSITVTIFEADGTSNSETINVSNGIAVDPGPVGSVLFPTEGQVLTQQQLTVSCDWESQDGIDPASVQISVDDGVTWVQMDAPGVNSPGGGT